MLFKLSITKGCDYKSMADFHAEDAKRIGFFLGDEPKTDQLEDLKLNTNIYEAKW